MGGSFSAQLHRVVSVDGWTQNSRGPTLRRLFGAYSAQDIWAVLRKFRQIDDGNGYIDYYEMSQSLRLSDFNLLFVWDLFSQQNELLDAKEFFTMLCIFSSALLQEKGRFLHALFDESQCGTVTGREIAKICTVVSCVLGKCSGTVIRPKEIIAEVKALLPEALPVYAEAETLVGDSAAFTKERILGNPELDVLLMSMRTAYEEMPFSGPPPEGSAPPLPPDFSGGGNETKSGGKPPAAGGGASAAKAQKAKGQPLSASELTHLAWMSRVGEDEGKENKSMNTFSTSQGFGGPTRAEPMPVHAWMVIYGGDFADIAKDLYSFKRLFSKSVSAAIGVPLGCIEVLNVSRGSIVVEFLMHPPCRGGDTREASQLVLVLESQLSTSHSALRKGPFAVFAESAALMAGNPSRASTPPGLQLRPLTPEELRPRTSADFKAQAELTGLPAVGAGSRCDRAMQTEPLPSSPLASSQRLDGTFGSVDMMNSTMGSGFDVNVAVGIATRSGNAAAMSGDPALLAALQESKARGERAEAAERTLRAELAEKDRLIAELRAGSASGTGYSASSAAMPAPSPGG